MQEWWGTVGAHLAEIDRPWAWLARRLGIDPSTLNKYKKGTNPLPDRVAREIELVLGMSRQKAA